MWQPEKCAIFGPFIFEENEITLTVNSYRYKNMITDFLGQKLKDEKSTWLTYGSSETGYSHVVRASMATVQALFTEHVIVRFGDLRSTEQMWKPCTLKELNKAAIRNLTALINVQLLDKVDEHFWNRQEKCEFVKTAVLLLVLFKKEIECILYKMV